MNSLNVNVAAIGRFAAATTLATAIAYSGVHYQVSKYTPDGTSAGNIVYEVKTESGGSVLTIDEVGNLSFSGAMLSGTGLTVGDTDGAGCTKMTCLDGNCAFSTTTCP